MWGNKEGGGERNKCIDETFWKKKNIATHEVPEGKQTASKRRKYQGLMTSSLLRRNLLTQSHCTKLDSSIKCQDRPTAAGAGLRCSVKRSARVTSCPPLFTCLTAVHSFHFLLSPKNVINDAPPLCASATSFEVYLLCELRDHLKAGEKCEHYLIPPPPLAFTFPRGEGGCDGVRVQQSSPPSVKEPLTLRLLFY